MRGSGAGGRDCDASPSTNMRHSTHDSVLMENARPTGMAVGAPADKRRPVCDGPRQPPMRWPTSHRSRLCVTRSSEQHQRRCAPSPSRKIIIPEQPAGASHSAFILRDAKNCTTSGDIGQHQTDGRTCKVPAQGHCVTRGGRRRHQPAFALAFWGTRGRGFKSRQPDHITPAQSRSKADWLWLWRL